MFGKIILVTLLAAVVFAVVAHGSPGGGPERSYVVRPGDTLWSIADARYGGDVRDAIWRIEQRNHLDGAAIRVGQRLVLPG